MQYIHWGTKHPFDTELEYIQYRISAIKEEGRNYYIPSNYIPNIESVEWLFEAGYVLKFIEWNRTIKVEISW